MDFVSDIVEREIDAPEPLNFDISQKSFGFPQPKPKKLSSWRHRKPQKKEEENKKDGFQVDTETGLKRLPKDKQKLDYGGLSEAERIHLENIEILSNMSEEQRLKEKEELLGSMDAGILQRLLNRSEKKLTKTKDNTIEGFGGEWIGGDKNGESWKEPTLDKTVVDDALGLNKKNLPQSFDDPTSDTNKAEGKQVKHVQFDKDTYIEIDEDKWEDVDDLDELAPPSYQLNKQIDSLTFDEAITNVHFTVPEVVHEDDYKIDLNDPDFDSKLHEKYFPDLPKETEKLQWMQSTANFDTSNLIYDDVSKLRFDFKGDLIIPGSNAEPQTSSGLYHHADNPGLAGYTLQELAHLSRSSFPGQRSIAIRTLGRVLHKLGKSKYSISPQFVNSEDGAPLDDDEVSKEEIENSQAKFEELLWDLVDQLKIILTLEESADEQYTPNVSVRSYAVEALWLWKQAGGRKITE